MTILWMNKRKVRDS